jgi:hypothetical protein
MTTSNHFGPSAQIVKQTAHRQFLRPEDNPSNIPWDAVISNSATAYKAPKRSKKERCPQNFVAPPPLQNDYSKSEAVTIGTRQIANTHPGSGLLIKPKPSRMKWTPENDRLLLLFFLGREVDTSDDCGEQYKKIAAWLPEKPTPKAIQERLTKLRAECRRVLKESGIYDPDFHEYKSMARRPSSIVPPSSSPMQPPPAKKTCLSSSATTPNVAIPSAPSAAEIPKQEIKPEDSQQPPQNASTSSRRGFQQPQGLSQASQSPRVSQPSVPSSQRASVLCTNSFPGSDISSAQNFPSQAGMTYLGSPCEPLEPMHPLQLVAGSTSIDLYPIGHSQFPPHSHHGETVPSLPRVSIAAQTPTVEDAPSVSSTEESTDER